MTETTPPQITQKLQIQIWWFTALFIAINVGLFGWQILSGVNITDPSPMDAITWGADFTPLTFSGQPERLFSSMFFHIFGLTVSRHQQCSTYRWNDHGCFTCRLLVFQS